MDHRAPIKPSKAKTCHRTDRPKKPTTDRPSMDTLASWMMDAEPVQATDGCIVEPDGRCPHGHDSWMIRLGII